MRILDRKALETNVLPQTMHMCNEYHSIAVRLLHIRAMNFNQNFPEQSQDKNFFSGDALKQVNATWDHVFGAWDIKPRENKWNIAYIPSPKSCGPAVSS